MLCYVICCIVLCHSDKIWRQDVVYFLPKVADSVLPVPGVKQCGLVSTIPDPTSCLFLLCQRISKEVQSSLWQHHLLWFVHFRLVDKLRGLKSKFSVLGFDVFAHVWTSSGAWAIPRGSFQQPSEENGSCRGLLKYISALQAFVRYSSMSQMALSYINMHHYIRP